MILHPPASMRELKAAFSASGLFRFGWTYDKAVADILVRRGLVAQVAAARRKTERHTGKPAPTQPALL